MDENEMTEEQWLEWRYSDEYTTEREETNATDNAAPAADTQPDHTAVESPVPDTQSDAPQQIIIIERVVEVPAAVDEAETVEAETVEALEPVETEGEPEQAADAESDAYTQEITQLLTEINDSLHNDRPALDTPFEEYTVSEALLLMLLVCVVGSWCVKVLRRGFSWLGLV